MTYFNSVLLILLQIVKQAESCPQLRCRVFFFQLVPCDGTDVNKSFIAYTKWAM